MAEDPSNSTLSAIQMSSITIRELCFAVGPTRKKPPTFRSTIILYQTLLRQSCSWIVAWNQPSPTLAQHRERSLQYISCHLEKKAGAIDKHKKWLNKFKDHVHQTKADIEEKEKRD